MTKEPNDPRSSLTDECVVDLYADLRRLAKRRLAAYRPDRLIQTTGLVHETFLRMSGSSSPQSWDNKNHFLSAASETMRRIVIDRLRNAQSLKRGSGVHPLPVSLQNLPDEKELSSQRVWQEFEEGLKELESEDPLIAKFARLLVYSGLSVSQAGAQLGLPRSTAYELWNSIREWFQAWSES